MNKDFFGIATELIRFTSTETCNAAGVIDRTLGEFCDHHKQWGTPASPLSTIARQLTLQGHLGFRGIRGHHWPFNEVYFSGWEKSTDLAYLTYDFLAFGFPSIRRHFSHAVVPIFVEDEKGVPDVGTGFLLHDGVIVTAAHCVQGKRSLRIRGWNPQAAPLSRLVVPTDSLDLAVLFFAGNPLPGVKGFEVREAEILDAVMTMGFPKLPGFRPVLITETTEIAAQTSIGEVVGRDETYLGGKDLLILSARVKGGSSGGPVVAKDGRVAGVVSSTPGSIDGPDPLGFGVAVPAEQLNEFLTVCRTDSSEVVDIRTRGNTEGVDLL